MEKKRKFTFLSEDSGFNQQLPFHSKKGHIRSKSFSHWATSFLCDLQTYEHQTVSGRDGVFSSYSEANST